MFKRSITAAIVAASLAGASATSAQVQNHQPAPAAGAPAAPTGTGAWVFNSTTSALDGRVSMSAHIQAENDVANIIGRPERPTLSLSCDQGGLFATVLWPDFVADGFMRNMATLRWKLDDGPVMATTMLHSAQGIGQMGYPAQGWIRQLSRGRRLIVQVPDRHGGQEATFNLEGIADIGPRFSEASCR